MPECLICYDDTKENPTDRLSCDCGILYHVECIEQWKEYNNTCPTCRKSFDVEEHKAPLQILYPSKCFICPDEDATYRSSTCNCNITFHEECYELWAKFRRMCPNCDIPYGDEWKVDENKDEFDQINVREIEIEEDMEFYETRIEELKTEFYEIEELEKELYDLQENRLFETVRIEELEKELHDLQENRLFETVRIGQTELNALEQERREIWDKQRNYESDEKTIEFVVERHRLKQQMRGASFCKLMGYILKAGLMTNGIYSPRVELSKCYGLEGPLITLWILTQIIIPTTFDSIERFYFFAPWIWLLINRILYIASVDLVYSIDLCVYLAVYDMGAKVICYILYYAYPEINCLKWLYCIDITINSIWTINTIRGYRHGTQI
jgi:hypothetical protein